MSSVSKTIGPWWCMSHVNEDNDGDNHGFEYAQVFRLDGDGDDDDDGDYDYAPAA